MVSLSAAGQQESGRMAAVLARIDAGDAKAEVGLQDRNRVSERTQVIQKIDSTIQERYGFEATQNLVGALADNTKINNQDPRRGPVVDISV